MASGYKRQAHQPGDTMEPRPIRMPDELWNALEEDAKAHNRMAAEHVRHICREYLEEDSEPVDERVAEIEQRLDRAEELEQYVSRIEELEQRVSELESRLEGATGEPTGRRSEQERTRGQRQQTETSREAETSTEPQTSSASQTGESRAERADPEPIEDIEDVLIKARQEYGQYDGSQEGKRRLAAVRDALELIRTEDKVPKDALRERLASEYAPRGKGEEVWWAETVQPGLQIASEWGVVVALSDGELEWIGPPE